jgi:copper(I)-binding protein
VNRTARTAGALVAAASLLLAAGCARTSTSVEYSPTDGSQVNTDQIALRNVVVVTDGKGGNALVAAAVNRTDQPDALTSISSGRAGLASGIIALPPFGAIYFGSADRPPLLVPGRPQAGTYVDLTFTFRRAGDVSVSALVVADAGEYKGTVEKARPGLVPDPDARREAGQSGAGGDATPTPNPTQTQAGGTEDETVRSTVP